MKKIILIWDFDGAIGLINASYPYNYNYSNLKREQDQVKLVLDLLDQYQIKCCFAITGFSAEEGIEPYTFPNLIKEIYERGHEIASHSWRHEWSSIFQWNQVDKSLKRSQLALEKAIGNQQKITGFVPPHNRPMSWLKRGAFSWGDRGVYPFFKAADNESIIKLLKKNQYTWVRVTFKTIVQKLFKVKRNPTGRVINYKGVTVLENHYTGFDPYIVDHILNTNHPTYTISAHPLMLDFPNKKESLANFKNFLEQLTASGQDIEFVSPIDLVV
ncbi:polysaccharide deacetylase family protein [Psychroflexus salinarum]|uniref:Polysaccharide deacetylase family protein n=1 Tax=Psychroflexus salinarum TaxID=546024 RepID=A0ABW3GRY4_9FLAO